MATTNNNINDAVNAPGLGGDLARSIATSVGQSELKSKITQAVTEAANQATASSKGGGVTIVRRNESGKPDRARMIDADVNTLKREGAGQKMEAYLASERDKAKVKLVEAKKSRDKDKLIDAECMLAAIKQVERELNTQQKPKSQTKQVKKVEKLIEDVSNQKDKKTKKKKAAALTKEMFGKDPTALPRNPTGNTKSMKNVRKEQKAKKQSDDSTKKEEKLKSDTKQMKAKKTTKQKSDEKPLFVKLKTQGVEAWRINIKDESVRCWLHDVYPTWRSLLDWKVEPCAFEKIIKENSDDFRYDKYIQPALSKIKPSFMRHVLHPKNFHFDETFDAWSAITYITSIMLQYFSYGKPDDSDKRLIDDLIASNDPDLSLIMTDKVNIKERAKYSTLFTHLLNVSNNESMQLVCPSIFRPGDMMNPQAALGEIRTYFQSVNNMLSLFGAFLRGEFESQNEGYPDYTYFTDPDKLSELMNESEKYQRATARASVKENTEDPHKDASGGQIDGNKEESHQDSCGATLESDSNQVYVESVGTCGTAFPRNVYIVATEATELDGKDLLCDKTPFEQSKPLQQLISLPDVTTNDFTVSAELRVISVDGDLNTKKNRPSENRCFIFHPVFRDPRLNDTEAVYAINVQHMAQILGHVSCCDDPREMVQNSLTSTSETNYIMPYQARAYLLSEQMIDIICAYRSVLFHSRPQMASVAACKVTEFRMDTKLKLVFHEQYKTPQRAWKLLHTIERDTGAIPLNERTLRYAISKRCKNAFNYINFCCAYRNLKAYCKLEYQFTTFVTFSLEHMFAFVNDFCQRKMLSFKQRLQLFEEAATISSLFDEDPQQVLTLLQNSLEKETKIFIKDEIYNKDTTPRFIVSPSPTVKIIFGCLMYQIEHYMFSRQNPSSKYFIKGLSEDEIKIDLESFSTSCPDGYVFVENDYISFEGSQPKPAQALIFGYWFAFTQTGSFERRILNNVYHWVTKYNWLHNKHFSLYRSIMKDSGLNDTSSSNGNLNKKNLRCVMCIEPNHMKIEGDDGVMTVKEDLVDTLSKLSMFPCTMDHSKHFYNLSFCGRQLDHNGKYVIQSDKEDFMFDKFNTYFTAEQTVSDQKRYDMAYMRYLSMCFKYPTEHFVNKIREMINNEFAHRGLHLSSGGVRSYFKQNWYALQNSPLYYLIRPSRYQYPSSVPKIKKEDFTMILRAPDPQRRFYEYSRFRTEFHGYNRTKLNVALGVTTAVVFGLSVFTPWTLPKVALPITLIAAPLTRLIVALHDQLSVKYKSLHLLSECFSQASTWISQKIRLRAAVAFSKRVAHNGRVDKLLRVPCTEPPISSLFGFHPDVLNEVPSDSDTLCDPDLSAYLDKDQISSEDFEKAIGEIARCSDGQPVVVPPNYTQMIDEYYKNVGSFTPEESFSTERQSPLSGDEVDLKASQAESDVLGYIKRIGALLFQKSLNDTRNEQY